MCFITVYLKILIFCSIIAKGLIPTLCYFAPSLSFWFPLICRSPHSRSSFFEPSDATSNIAVATNIARLSPPPPSPTTSPSFDNTAHILSRRRRRKVRKARLFARENFSNYFTTTHTSAPVEGMKVFKPGDGDTYAFSLRNSLRPQLAKLFQLRRKMAFSLCERTFCK